AQAFRSSERKTLKKSIATDFSKRFCNPVCTLFALAKSVIMFLLNQTKWFGLHCRLQPVIAHQYPCIQNIQIHSTKNRYMFRQKYSSSSKKSQLCTRSFFEVFI